MILLFISSKHFPLAKRPWFLQRTTCYLILSTALFNVYAMQPNTPDPASAPVPPPYDPNANQAKQHKLIRLIVILAVAAVLVAILLSLFSGPPKNSELSAVLANQQEMLRIIDARRENLTTSDTANFVSVVRPVLVSHGRELGNAGVAVTVAVDGSAIDAQLDEAVRNSRLDQSINDLLLATIREDKTTLEQLAAASDDELKPIIQAILQDYSALAEE